MNVYASSRIGCYIFYEAFLEIYEARFTDTFEIQSFGIGRKSFVKPNIAPGAAGYLVAKPLVRQFVRNQIGLKLSHKGDSGMLHSSATTNLGMSILFISIWIRAKNRFKKFHYLNSNWRVLPGLR